MTDRPYLAAVEDQFDGEPVNNDPGPGDRDAPTAVHNGQLWMAYRLAEQYAEQLIYVPKLGWHYWTGQRWERDELGYAQLAVYDEIRRALTDNVGDKTLIADVRRCQSATAVSGILKLASVLKPFATSIDDLDTDPWLLNCANGTLNLRTLELQPQDPADRITKITNAAYTPDASGETWTQFIQRVLPNNEVREYLQRLTGLSLLGQVNGDKQVAPIMTGQGANGKSTFIEAVLFALGDYAMPGDPDLLLSRSGDAHPTGSADLVGKRLVATSETKEGRKFDLAMLKRLTGGDTIKARFMRQDFFSFKPSHLLLLATNTLPEIDDSSPAVWRRVRVIPFEVQLPETEWNKSIGDQLQLEADAVLRWAIEGWSDYRERGNLGEPNSVLLATGEYRSESDVVGRFIEECCYVGGAQTKSQTQVLYKRFTQWAANDMSMIAFSRELTKKGYPVDNKAYGRPRIGICLLQNEEENR